MTHHDRRNPATSAPIVAVDIASADPAGTDPNSDFVGRNGRFGKINDLKSTVFDKLQRFHSDKYEPRRHCRTGTKRLFVGARVCKLTK